MKRLISAIVALWNLDKQQPHEARYAQIPEEIEPFPYEWE